MPDNRTIGELKRLFTSSPSRGPARDHNDEIFRLRYCLQNDLIARREEVYDLLGPPEFVAAGDKETYERAYEKAMRGARKGIKGGQSPGHGRLKYNAWDWCKGRFGVEPEIEESRRDVSLWSAGVWIECGNTKPQFAFEHFFWPDPPAHVLTNGRWETLPSGVKWKYFVLCPFSEDFSLHIFEPTDEGRKVLPRYMAWQHGWKVWEKCEKSESTRDRYQELLGREIRIPDCPPEPYNLGLCLPGGLERHRLTGAPAR